MIIQEEIDNDSIQVVEGWLYAKALEIMNDDIRTMEELIEIYNSYCNINKLPYRSADEWEDGELTVVQQEWMTNFIADWELMRESERWEEFQESRTLTVNVEEALHMDDEEGDAFSYFGSYWILIREGGTFYTVLDRTYIDLPNLQEVEQALWEFIKEV